MQFKDFYLKVNIGENEAKLYEQKYLILIKIGKFEYYSIDDLKEKSIEVIKKLKHSQLIKMEMIKEIDSWNGCLDKSAERDLKINGVLGNDVSK